uniref:Uncharacterized protein n=1 Tax=Cacopsylla melanoneura TaxID=428564 RepID=A0A8D8M053_9HEMI
MYLFKVRTSQSIIYCIDIPEPLRFQEKMASFYSLVKILFLLTPHCLYSLFYGTFLKKLNRNLSYVEFKQEVFVHWLASCKLNITYDNLEYSLVGLKFIAAVEISITILIIKTDLDIMMNSQNLHSKNRAWS